MGGEEDKVFVCVRERERARERACERERARERDAHTVCIQVSATAKYKPLCLRGLYAVLVYQA